MTDNPTRTTATHIARFPGDEWNYYLELMDADMHYPFTGWRWAEYGYPPRRARINLTQAHVIEANHQRDADRP